MTTMAENPTTPPTPLSEMTRDDVKRELVEAVVAQIAAEERVKALYAETDARNIPVHEFAKPLQDDERIEWVHETTWGRRRNKALGRPDWRSDDPTIRRRNRRQ